MASSGRLQHYVPIKIITSRSSMVSINEAVFLHDSISKDAQQIMNLCCVTGSQVG